MSKPEIRMTKSERNPDTKSPNRFGVQPFLPFRVFRVFRGLIFLSLFSLNLFAADTVLYENNFEKEEVGKVPPDFMVLDGGFTVREEAGNKFLELPGAPLDTFAVQFGPTESSDLSVSARILATAKGRRFPTFGIGLDGVAGYKLQAAPGKKALELLKDQKVLATVPYDWKSAEWLIFRLQVRKTGDPAWRIEGRTWPQGSAEPSAWTITAEEKEEPNAGRPSVFGSPFSGTPIWYDDLRVEKAK